MDIAVLNNSGVPILIGQVVYQTGFVQPQQVPSVALASAVSSTTARALGLAVTNIANNTIGQVRISGNFSPIDTSTFLVNHPAYLSDTLGEISNTPGTIEVIVGQVIVVSAISGCIRIACRIVGDCDTGGGGAQGTTGLQGATGLGADGITGLIGATGIQGATGLGAGSGTTGLQGDTGLQGATGLGADGVTGLIGATGIQGITGIQGATGLGADGVTGLIGATGIQGNTGVQGFTGLQGVTGFGTTETITYLEMSNSQSVPGGGIRFLRVGQTFTSDAGYQIFEAVTLTAISIRVNVADATNDYDLEILSPSSVVAPTVIATLSLPSGSISASTTSVSVAIPAGSELGARLNRTAGAGTSDFSNYVALLRLE